jgi:hypothetical protein
MSEWQPIESAPKDGTVILAYCAPRYVESGEPMGWGYINAVWWRDEYMKKKYGTGYSGMWPWRHHQNDSAAEPTRWQPLPPPPTP